MAPMLGSVVSAGSGAIKYDSTSPSDLFIVVLGTNFRGKVAVIFLILENLETKIFIVSV